MSNEQPILPQPELPTDEKNLAGETTEKEALVAGAVNAPVNDTANDTVDHSVGRRRFLGGMASGLLSLVAAACGRDRATPTPTLRPTATAVSQSSLIPTPTKADYYTYLPFAHREGDAAVAAVPTETPLPTETPTPAEPTATPPPPPTPTPSATPFPAGRPSKLGFVVGRNHPEIFEMLKTKAVSAICTLELDVNFAAQIKQTSPNTLLIGRLPHLEQVQLGVFDPIPAAQAFVNEVMVFAGDERRRTYFDGWQSYNEPAIGSADDMKKLADFEAERTRLLAAQGIRSVIGNFATGTPELEMWQHFLPAIQAAKEYNGWLGLHEYSAPTIYYLSTRDNQGRYPGVSPEDTGWLTLRYRQVYNQILKPANLAIPLVFTELGVDGLVTNRPGPPEAKGWQDFQTYWRDNGYGLWGPGAYIEQLAWFDEAMRQDSYVLGGCIFSLAGSDGWQSYDLLGPAAGVLKQYLTVHAPA
ncbi:MAG: hypothetical protein KF832_03820 [Caldilineaceae bacterium]|nr:hypothetical protein [Caldilineaceae bacterium]